MEHLGPLVLVPGRQDIEVPSAHLLYSLKELFLLSFSLNLRILQRKVKPQISNLLALGS